MSALDKLLATIKQGFQLLYTFPHGFQDKVMLMIRHSCQIFRTVIMSNTIKVMHDPPIWQWFIMRLLPNYPMFIDVSIVLPRMVRSINHYISIFTYMSSAFPMDVIITSRRMLLETSSAHLRSYIARLSAVYTWVVSACSMVLPILWSPHKNIIAHQTVCLQCEL